MKKSPHRMRWLIIFALTVATSFGQEETSLQTLRRINAELAESNARMSAEISANEQLYEMREQTRLLEKISKGNASGPSAGYVAPSTYTPPPTISSTPKPSEWYNKRQDDTLQATVMRLAQRAKSFSPATNQPRARQLSVREGYEYKETTTPTNETFIKSLLQGYVGTFTDYGWTMEKIDQQTYLVTCNVSLDGEPHDFKFKVNTQVESCRYEGGTALGKLTQSKPKPAGQKQNWRKFYDLD